MSDWKEIGKILQESTSSGGLFVRVKDEPIEGVLMGAPKVFYRETKGNWKTEHDSPADGRSMRFKINLAVKQGDGWSAKILEGPKTMLEQMYEVHEKYGPKQVFEFKRKGTPPKVTYSVLPSGDVSAEEWQAIQNLELRSLEPRGGNDFEPTPF